MPKHEAITSRRHRLLAVLAGSLLALPAVLVAAGLPAGRAYAAPPPPSSPQSDRATWSIQAATAGKGDTRPTFSYNSVVPGSSQKDAVAIRNFGDKSLKLSVYASDARNTETGGFDLLPAAEKPTDIGSWIRMEKSSVTVPAHKVAVVPFTITTPENATPGYHVGGIVASESTAAVDSSGNHVRVDRRVGMRIFQQIAGPLNPKLTVEDVSVRYSGGWDPVHSGTATVSYTISNTGNVPMQAHRTVGVSGLFGLLGKTGKQADLPLLLPGNSITLTTRTHGVWPGGRLHAKVELEPFTSVVKLTSAVEPATGSGNAWAMPWTWLIALVFVLLVVGVRVLRRVRRTRAARATEEPPAESQELEEVRL